MASNNQVYTALEKDFQVRERYARHYDVIEDIEVNLTNQNLNELDPRKIKSDATVVILDKNGILKLPDDLTFMPNVDVLRICSQLSVDQISKHRKPALLYIPSSISNLHYLGELFLCNNALTDLPESMGQMDSLRTLDLRMNLFKMVPNCIASMRSLEILRLCGNKLRSLPSSISNLTRLAELTLAHNKLETLPNDIGYPSSLTTLDLRCNRLVQLPRSLAENSTGLFDANPPKGLLLERNPWTYPPQEEVERGPLAVLQFLRSEKQPVIKRNNRHSQKSIRPDTSFQTISEQNEGHTQPNFVMLSNGEFKSKELNLRNLQQFQNSWSEQEGLDVSHCKIETLDVDLKKLKKLETLVLEANHVSAFPIHAIKGMKSLRKLNLNKQQSRSEQGIYAHLQMFPADDMIHISHLTHLHMTNNRINAIPSGIKYMKKLVELDLIDNKDIKTVPSEIGALSELAYLGLSGNCIEHLPASIGKLGNLEVLRLSCNKLRELPEEICNLKKLMTLSLQDNRLVYLPLHLDKLTLLATNGIAYVSPLMKQRQFKSTLNVKKNPPIRFPSTACHEMSAREIFDEYESLHGQGDGVMREAYMDAKEYIRVAENSTRSITHTLQGRDWHFIDDTVFHQISGNIGYDWRRLGSILGFSSEKLDHCEINHRGNIADTIAAMFIQWRDANGNADERHLVRQLCTCMEEAELRALKKTFLDLIIQHRKWVG